MAFYATSLNVKLENTSEELKGISEKYISDITKFDYPSNSRRCKKTWRDNIIRWLLGGTSKETVAAIIMLYKNTTVKVHSLDGDTDYFDTVTGVLQGDT